MYMYSWTKYIQHQIEYLTSMYMHCNYLFPRYKELEFHFSRQFKVYIHVMAASANAGLLINN